MWKDLIRDFWHRFWWGITGIIIVAVGAIWLIALPSTVEVSGYRVSQANAKATEYYAAGEIDKAQAAYEVITQRHPRDWFAWNGLANIYRDKNQYGLAETAYLKALDINPKFEQGYRNIFNLYYSWSERDNDPTSLAKSESVLLQGHKLLPKSVTILEDLITYYAKINDQVKLKIYKDRLTELQSAK